jgi:hypothetical protein
MREVRFDVHPDHIEDSGETYSCVCELSTLPLLAHYNEQDLDPSQELKEQIKLEYRIPGRIIGFRFASRHLKPKFSFQGSLHAVFHHLSDLGFGC